MRKMYNIGELVEIKQEKVIGSKYGTIHNKYKSLSTGKPVYTVLYLLDYIYVFSSSDQ